MRVVTGVLVGAAVAWPLRCFGQLTKAQQILIDRGLQIEADVDPGAGFDLGIYQALNYTTVDWEWSSTPQDDGAAPGLPWARWVSDPTQMPPQGSEAPYLSQLVSLSLSDEPDLDDTDTFNQMVSWFNSVRSSFPNTILYVNNWGGQISDQSLGNFITQAQPDMISFDDYPWQSDYSTGTPIGGPPTDFYDQLWRYRQFGIQYNVPIQVYLQTFHAVQDYNQTIYRDPSPSELRLNAMAALAFNAKSLADFAYNGSASSLFVDGDQSQPTELYSEEADINHQVQNLGKALVELKPISDATTSDGHTTSMMIIRGKEYDSSDGKYDTPTPLPWGFDPSTSAPNSYSDWVYQRNDPYLNGWVVTNKGTTNGGAAGDVIVSWFTPLDENLDGPDYSNEKYLMVVNGLTSTTGTAADCEQEIKLNFSFPAGVSPSLIELDPETGLLDTIELTHLSGTKYQWDFTLDGGDAVLFKYNDGAPFVGVDSVPEPAALLVLGLAPVGLLRRRVRRCGQFR